MPLSGEVIRAALAAAGAVGKQIRPLDELAAGAAGALRQAPARLTPAGAAAFLATCAIEAAWFRTTVEYGTSLRYDPYRGRTFIQLTWEANYLGFGKWCHARGLVADPLVFVRDPVQLGAFEYAWLGPVYYFEVTRLWEWANAGDFRRVSQAVNGGRSRAGTAFLPHGWGDRQAMYAVFLRAGTDLLPASPSPTPRPPASVPATAVEVDDMFTEDDRRMVRTVYDELTKRHPSRVDFGLLGETPPAAPVDDTAVGYAINADARAYEAREVALDVERRVAELRELVAGALARPAAGITADEVRALFRSALAELGPLFLTTKESP